MLHGEQTSHEPHPRSDYEFPMFRGRRSYGERHPNMGYELSKLRVGKSFKERHPTLGYVLHIFRGGQTSRKNHPSLGYELAMFRGRWCYRERHPRRVMNYQCFSRRMKFVIMSPTKVYRRELKRDPPSTSSVGTNDVSKANTKACEATSDSATAIGTLRNLNQSISSHFGAV